MMHLNLIMMIWVKNGESDIPVVNLTGKAINENVRKQPEIKH